MQIAQSYNSERADCHCGKLGTCSVYFAS